VWVFLWNAATNSSNFERPRTFYSEWFHFQNSIAPNPIKIFIGVFKKKIASEVLFFKVEIVSPIQYNGWMLFEHQLGHFRIQHFSGHPL